MEVHPPTHPVSTWREVFIHLGIVTVGLLIALGLEAGVEWQHHRHQVEVTRMAIAKEKSDNVIYQRHNLALLQQEMVRDRGLLEDFRYLKQHPGTAMANLPTPPVWWHAWNPLGDSAWKTAHETGVLAHMPREEVQRLEGTYDLVNTVNADQLNVRAIMRRAGEYRVLDQDLSHLSPAQIDREIELCTQLMAALMGLANDMGDLRNDATEFAALSSDEIQDVMAPMPPELTAAFHGVRDATAAEWVKQNAELAKGQVGD